MAGVCEECGGTGASVTLSGELLCDRCVDDRISEFTGMSRMPDPPADEVFTGADTGHWPGSQPGHNLPFDMPDDDDVEAFLDACDAAESEAVDLLRRALSKLREEQPPVGDLQAAAGRLRGGIKGRTWPHLHMGRAAGFGLAEPLSNLELWLGATGGLISMREESGLDDEVEASLMSLEHADWMGAIVGLVRAGVGASADPAELISYINRCPEVEGKVDADDVDLVEAAFESILPAWEAAGAVDRNRRLTALGRWGLPRALAWAWSGDFDAPGEPGLLK